jgi:hypothetical protein
LFSRRAGATSRGRSTSCGLRSSPRADVRASLELLEALRAEFDRHPIGLDPCRAYSPASVAKAYLRTMGVRPMGDDVRGIAQSLARALDG